MIFIFPSCFSFVSRSFSDSGRLHLHLVQGQVFIILLGIRNYVWISSYVILMNLISSACVHILYGRWSILCPNALYMVARLSDDSCSTRWDLYYTAEQNSLNHNHWEATTMAQRHLRALHTFTPFFLIHATPIITPSFSLLSSSQPIFLRAAPVRHVPWTVAGTFVCQIPTCTLFMYSIHLVRGRVVKQDQGAKSPWQKQF